MNFKILLMILLCNFPYYFANRANSQKLIVEDISDTKEFKKLLRTKTNVLICFINSSSKQTQPVIKVFREVAQVIKGQGTMVLIDCSLDAKKLCKKLKVAPDPHVLKHYKDGEFNKDYDRKISVTSMVNFMRDPTGDIPWEEDSSAENVVHIPDAGALSKFFKKEYRPTMVMFYTPWCGFCKQLKPDYAAAAVELKDQAVLAAIDVNRPENAVIRTQYNITGFPTLLYYEGGKLKYQYEGDNNKNAIINFMKNPQQKSVKVKEPEWSDIDSEIVHLTTESFDPVLKDEQSVLVMFYAPWCGHCKRMKPEYEKAANEMKMKDINGMLAALDATKETAIGQRFGVKGYPTLKYFSYGEFKFDVNIRDAGKIIEFMRDPKEPPPPPPPEKLWSEEESEVVHLNEETFKPFLKKKKHVLLIFYAPWCGHCKKSKPEFTAAAEVFKDDPRVEFAAVDCTQHQTLCNLYDVKGYPTIIYFQYYKTHKPYTGGRTKDDFVRFMTHPDSESTVKSDQDNLVRDLSYVNFDNVVQKSNAVFVLFYDKRCVDCKDLKREFNNLATDLQNNVLNKENGVIVASVDCDVNVEIANKYKIKQFPSIKLFKKGGEYIEDYVGNKSVKDMKNYLSKKTKGINIREEL